MPDQSLSSLPELPDRPRKPRRGTGKKLSPLFSALRKRLSLSAGRRRVLVRVLQATGIALLSVTALLLAALLFVQVNFDRFSAMAQEELRRSTGWELKFARASMSVFPLPALRLEEVELRPGDGMVFCAESVDLVPSLVALLQGKAAPDYIRVKSPSFAGRLPVRLTDLAGLGRGSGKGSGALELPAHVKLSLSDGRVDVLDADGSLLRLKGLDLDASLVHLPPLENPLNGVSLSLALESFQFQSARYAACLADLSLQGSASLADPLRSLSGRLRVRSAFSPLHTALSCDLSFERSEKGLQGSGFLRGSFQVDGTAIPFALAGSLSPAGGGTADLPYADMAEKLPEGPLARLMLTEFVLGEDRLQLDGLAPSGSAAPALAGRLSFTHVSLTRWLTFARHLSPGLQIALDEISDGRLDFYLDADTLEVPRIHAVSSGSVFSGRGGVASWRNPVIFLDLTSPFVDLGRAIPEAVGRIPGAPFFGHRPLTELKGSDLAPPESAEKSGRAEAPGGNPAPEKAIPEKTEEPPRPQTKAVKQPPKPLVDYDIRLGAEAIHYGYVDLSKGSVIIHPGVTSRGEGACRLDFTTALYGGRCEGQAFFSGETESEYEFSVTTANVNMAGLRAAMPFLPVVRGTGQSRLKVESRGSEISRFLANLRGTASVIVNRSGYAGGIAALGQCRTEISLDLESAAFRQSSLGLSGRWDVHLHGGAWSAEAALPGMIWFGGQGVRFEGVPVSLACRNLEAFAPSQLKGKDIPLTFSGLTSLDTGRMSLGVEKAGISFPGLRLTGSLGIRINRQAATVTAQIGKAQAEVIPLAQAVAGRSPDLPALFRELTFTDTVFEAAPKRLRLAKFSTAVDGIPVSGEIAASFEKTLPDLTFQVRCGHVDLDQRLGGKEKGSGAGAKGAKKTWDFSFMKEFTASGRLQAASLLVKKVLIQSLQANLRLDQGRLAVTGGTGTVYGGKLTASGNMRFDRGLAFDSSLQVQQFDLGDMLRARKTRGLFTGKLDFRADISSVMTGPGEFTRSLNGNLAFTGGRCSYQAVHDDFRPKGEPTFFTSASSSAILEKGVLRTNDFQLRGTSLSLTGQGWFDLNSETMDASFTADMTGLPYIPVRLHGSFDKPKTSISGGGILLNAIGGLAKGFYNLVGGVLGGIADIFR